MRLTPVRRSSEAQEYEFELAVDGERVPAVLWTPLEWKGPHPLVLMGHGATQHKRTEMLIARAERYAGRYGFATLAIDAQGHGDRAVGDADAMARDVLARVTGAAQAAAGPSPIFKTMGERARRIVPEWKAALDAVQDFIGAGQPIGYWGLSMGTVLGVPLIAAEPRITCAVLGLGGVRPKDEAFLDACRRITVPVEYAFQWDDPIAPRESGLALFDALGSDEKSMHVNPGGHGDIPTFESDSWDTFFLRHMAGRQPA